MAGTSGTVNNLPVDGMNTKLKLILVFLEGNNNSFDRVYFEMATHGYFNLLVFK
jgi:hypothetical protein